MQKAHPPYGKVIFIFSLLIALTSCYRMPDENDFSLVPTTNNPAVTCEKSSSLIPGAKY